MATILEFRVPVESVPERRRGRRRRGTAQIVIFPGVRYERWTEDKPATAAAAKAPRDVLTLTD